jgi:hypothetical protein
LAMLTVQPVASKSEIGTETPTVSKPAGGRWVAKSWPVSPLLERGNLPWRTVPPALPFTLHRATSVPALCLFAKLRVGRGSSRVTHP